MYHKPREDIGGSQEVKQDEEASREGLFIVNRHPTTAANTIRKASSILLLRFERSWRFLATVMVMKKAA